MTYQQPLALVVISSISIGIAGCAALWIAIDIVLRRGWKSMMAIMIPVYILNALYLWPITLWTYLNYGRPTKPSETSSSSGCHHHSAMEAPQSSVDSQESQQQHQSNNEPVENHHAHHHNSHAQSQDIEANHNSEDAEKSGHEHMHHDTDRPLFATVTIAVCHCGAGCVLGDIIGEWIVYATGATLGSPPRALWVEYLVDFAFAFAFGIFFQYFSIAPMAGDYSPKILIRAFKADALSLLFFEVGLFGWMAAFQIGIFGDRLPVNSVTYWWMMQIGMFIGHWTGIPINWWLIKKGIKEPCA